jgi:hypothetical protein
MIGVFLVFGLEIKLKEYDYKIAFEISNLRVPSTCTDMLTNSIKSSYWLVATIQPALVVSERFLKYKGKDEMVLEYRSRDIFCRLNSIELFYYTVGFI